MNVLIDVPWRKTPVRVEVGDSVYRRALAGLANDKRCPWWSCRSPPGEPCRNANGLRVRPHLCRLHFAAFRAMGFASGEMNHVAREAIRQELVARREKRRRR